MCGVNNLYSCNMKVEWLESNQHPPMYATASDVDVLIIYSSVVHHMFMLQEWLSVQPDTPAMPTGAQNDAEIIHQDNFYGLYIC